MKRRTFLARLSLGVVVIGGALYVSRRRLKERWLSSSLRERVRETILGVDPSSGTSALSEDEAAQLLKLAGTVLPSDAGEPGQAIVLDRLRWRAGTSPGYASEFRRALALLDQEAEGAYGEQSRFAQLSGTQAAAVVGSLLDGIVAHEMSDSSRKDLLRLATDSHFRNQYRLRRHVVNEMLEGYYRSPLAWRRQGYRSFPGACAGIVIYSKPPDAA